MYRGISSNKPEHRFYKFISGWYLKIIGIGFLASLNSCGAHQYSVIQSLDEPDSLGYVTYHLVRIKNNDVVLMKLQGDLPENHIIKLKKKDIPKDD